MFSEHHTSLYIAMLVRYSSDNAQEEAVTAARGLSRVFRSAFKYYELHTASGRATGRGGKTLTADAMQRIHDAVAEDDVRSIAFYSARDLAGLFVTVAMPSSSAGRVVRFEIGIDASGLMNLDGWLAALMDTADVISGPGRVIYGIAEPVLRDSAYIAQIWKLLYCIHTHGFDENALMETWYEVNDVPSRIREMPWGLMLCADEWTSVPQLREHAGTSGETWCRTVGDLDLFVAQHIPDGEDAARHVNSRGWPNVLVGCEWMRIYRNVWRRRLKTMSVVHRGFSHSEPHAGA